MKVVIAGAGGQLGLDLLDAYTDHDVVGLRRSDLDISDESAVLAAIDALRPDLVINAAAWTDVDGCEADRARAHRVNALGPSYLARACVRVSATLVHVSTDYVFSGPAPRGLGGEPRGFTEFDLVAPANEYGRSKAASEVLVRETLPEHHIVRTSWVNGARGHNFVRTMLRLGTQREYLKVVDDQVGCPTFTRSLAVSIREVASSGRFGTINRTNVGSCSWYDLALATFEAAGMDVEVRRTSTEAFGRGCPRPTWSVLDNLHARCQGLTDLPPWQAALRAMLAELNGQRLPNNQLEMMR
jgi:dTDP-4-dehydrorhamnose reductase